MWRWAAHHDQGTGTCDAPSALMVFKKQLYMFKSSHTVTS